MKNKKILFPILSIILSIFAIISAIIIAIRLNRISTPDGLTIIFLPIGFLVYSIVAYKIFKKYNSSIRQKAFIGSFIGMNLILIPFSYSLIFPSQYMWEFVFYLLGAIPSIIIGGIIGYNVGKINSENTNFSKTTRLGIILAIILGLLIIYLNIL